MRIKQGKNIINVMRLFIQKHRKPKINDVLIDIQKTLPSVTGASILTYYVEKKPTKREFSAKNI